ncbi:MAG TPA: biopolymer transporter ExbD [bacterium]|nr:biopolymer transporter ExbD [bacterium]HOX86392.1 biopolymer transporter ExbD [bacterium]HPG45779.1 biopolymer transporter ExbD [bacterium]HPM97994.1 biopolymer transporter ExbD [bacterium]
MNLKNAIETRRRDRQESDLDLTPVMNIFLILIPFLLLTAVFVKIAVLELSLPNLERQGAVAQQQERKTVVLNFLFIKETGFEVRSPDLKLPAIPKTAEGYDWSTLSDQLKAAKSKYPDSEDIIIAPVNSITYETIISVMDRCRESGFTNISISG